MPFVDITGKTFHRLTVVSCAGIIKRQSHWNCVCSCGNTLKVRGSSLKSGNTKSCGCQKIDSATKHGHNRVGKPSPTYVSWMSMIARCTKPSHQQFARYGGRGIALCKRWNSFENFLADMGERQQGKTLDRINNDLGYSPENCRWSTPKEQSCNRKNTRKLTHNNETKSLSEWADILQIPRMVLQDRIRLGWNDERIITTSYRPRLAKC